MQRMSETSIAAVRCRPWLHRIVVNRSLDWVRSRRIRPEVHLEELPLQPSSDDDPFDERHGGTRGARTGAARADRPAPPARLPVVGAGPGCWIYPPPRSGRGSRGRCTAWRHSWTPTREGR